VVRRGLRQVQLGAVGWPGRRLLRPPGLWALRRRVPRRFQAAHVSYVRGIIAATMHRAAECGLSSLDL
jgi:hypothetical protein